MKKLVFGVLSIGMVFFSSCSSDDGVEGGETPKVKVDPTNVSIETLNGVWEVVSIIDNDDNDRVVKKGETFDYFEGEDCPEKPYSRDQFIDEKLAFVGDKSYFKYEFSEQKYIYDDVEMTDDGEFKSCDTSGKKLGVKKVELDFSVGKIDRVVVVGNTIYYVEIDNDENTTHYSASRIIVGDEITLAYSAERTSGGADLTTLSYTKSATLKKVSDSVDLADFNNGVEAEFVNGKLSEEKDFFGSGSGTGIISFRNECKYDFISQTNSLSIELEYEGDKLIEGFYSLNISTDVGEKINGDENCTPVLFDESLWGDLVIDGNNISFTQTIGESVGLSSVVYEFTGTVDGETISGTGKHSSGALEETIVYNVVFN